MNGLFNYFKTLLTVSASSLNVQELASQFKMKEFVVKKNREQAVAIGEKQLEKYVAYIYRSIADIKSGLLTPQSALQNVQNAIFFGFGKN